MPPGYISFLWNLICVAYVASFLAILLKRAIFYGLALRSDIEYRITVKKSDVATATYVIESRLKMWDQSWGKLISFPSLSEAERFMQGVGE